MTTAFPPLPVARLREQFPALSQTVGGQPALFLDGPGGSQAPARVGEAMAGYLNRDNANAGGAFATSQRTAELVRRAREAAAAFLGAARREEIVFGQNMTSLAFPLARALARTWRDGDEIVVTQLDHDANVAPWTTAARDRGGVAARTWDFHPEDGCRLRLDGLAKLLNARTRLVALTHASNALGTVPDVAGAVRLVRERAPGARVFVDAVHYAPHGPLDVQALGCDFLACSAYKFFGPHLGLLYGRHDLLEELTADKVRASSDLPPGKWETGTQSFESLAGLVACLDYLAELGENAAANDPRACLVRAMRRVREHEAGLSRAFLTGLRAAAIPGLRLFGIVDPDRVQERTPTFAVTLENMAPRVAAERLGERGIFVWDGDFYAVNVVDRLALRERGGLIRLGFLHYHAPEDVARTVAALAELATA